MKSWFVVMLANLCFVRACKSAQRDVNVKYANNFQV